MTTGYLFEGRIIKKPQAVSVVKDEGLAAAGIVNPITIAILGTAAAGRPEWPYEFFSAADAQTAFMSGNLPEAIRRAYQPGGERGAYRVVGVRLNGDVATPANRAVQATKILQDATPANALTLTAGEWGVQGNNLAVSVANGTDAGTKKITVFWRGAELQGDNIGAPGIQIQYTGAGASGSGAVTSTQLTTTIAATPADDLALSFATYNTLQKLVDAINATGKYTASVLNPNPDAPSTDLDVVAVADVKATPVALRADLAAQLAWFQGLGAEILTAVEPPGGGGKPAANVAKTFFTGGIDPTITTNSWQQGLDVLATEDVQIVVPVSADPAVHAMARTHCETMSGVTQKGERVCIVGGAWGESVATARGAALALNSDRAQRVHPGLFEDAGNGTLAQVPPYMVAAMKAGLTAGLALGTSATYKHLNAAGVETKYSLQVIESLLDSGICTIEHARNVGYRIVQDKTTWLRDNRITRRELALRLALDSVSRRLRAVADRYIGSPTAPSFRGEVTGALVAELTRMESANLIVGDANTPAYRNLQVNINSEIVEIRVEVTVAAPANYIGIIIVPTIYSGVAA